MSSQKCPFLWGYVPRSTHGSFSPPSLQPNRQLDRFIRFRRAHLLVYYRSDSPIVVHTKREHCSALRCIPSRYVTSQLGQLSLASLRGCSIEYQLNFAGVNAGMSPLPVTLCDQVVKVVMGSRGGSASEVETHKNIDSVLHTKTTFQAHSIFSVSIQK